MSPSKKKPAAKAAAKSAGSKAAAGEAAEEVSFEEALERLEQLVERLEEGDVPLEESLGHYAEGTRLVKLCQERLDRAEALIRELTETAEGFGLKPSGLGGEDEDDDEDGYEDEDDEDDNHGTGEFNF